MSGDDFPHGEQRGYKRGCRCGACRKANADRHRALRSKRATLPAGDIPHGLGGYRNYNCRCPDCSAAHSSDLRAQEAKRAGSSNIPHGTASGRGAWGCRCEPCVQAYRVRLSGYQARRNRQSQESAYRAGLQWTGPELELASRPDLSIGQVAAMLGRSYWSVHTKRSRLKEPMNDHVAGVSRASKEQLKH